MPYDRSSLEESAPFAGLHLKSLLLTGFQFRCAGSPESRRQKLFIETVPDRRHEVRKVHLAHLRHTIGDVFSGSKLLGADRQSAIQLALWWSKYRTRGA